MKTRLRNSLRLSVLLATTLALSGCLFGNALSIFFSEGTVFISIGDVDITLCGNEDDAYVCIGDPWSSSFTMLTDPELLLTLIILDPLVLQVPANVDGFAGAYLHNDSGVGGALAIQSGLTSIRLDRDRDLNAEPGMQLVVVGLPKGAPLTGNFSFNLNFQVPPATTALPIKPIITGLVEHRDGAIFYPPIFPCVENMANAPALLVPLPVPGDTFTLPPLPADQGCNGTAYNYIGDGGEPPPPAGDAMPVPGLSTWSLLLLTVILTAAGALVRYRSRLEQR